MKFALLVRLSSVRIPTRLLHHYRTSSTMTSKPTIVPTKKTVLITGCSAGGIGAALADAFHQKGYHVFATARTPSKIPETLSRSPNVTVITLDVLSSVSIADAVVSVGSKLDVLVNNSGGGYTIPALDTSIEEGKKLFDLNYWAPLAMLQAFAPLLINAKGCIVNNTSANAYLPMPLMSKSFPKLVFFKAIGLSNQCANRQLQRLQSRSSHCQRDLASRTPTPRRPHRDSYNLRRKD